MMVGNMVNEIIEAISIHFDDNKDIAVDCFRYIAEKTADDDLANAMLDRVVEMGYCPICGEKKSVFHNDGDGEIVLCRRCDLGEED